MKRYYVKPIVKVKAIETEEMLAASPSLELKDSNYEDDNSLILNSKGSNFNIWDSEEGDSHSGIDWDE